MTILLPNEGMPLVYEGCNFGSYSRTQLYCNPGTLAKYDGKELDRTPTYNLSLMCDVSTVGIKTNWDAAPLGWSHTLGGMDAPISGWNAHIYFYMMQHAATGDLALLGSEVGNYDLKNKDSRPGWDTVRQMHFGCVYRQGWGGLPEFFQCVDNSRVLYSEAGEWAGYQIMPESASYNERRRLSLASWVLNDVRTVWLFFHIANNGRGAGTAYVWFSPSAPAPFPVGQTDFVGDNRFLFMPVKLDSDSCMDWMTNGGGATLAVYGPCLHEFDDPT